MKDKPQLSPTFQLGPAEVELEYTTLAMYRMAGLPTPFDFAALSNGKTAIGALVAWVWACLPEAHHAAFPSPAAVANSIDLNNAHLAMKALVAAIQKALPEEKNAVGSTRKHSSTSS